MPIALFVELWRLALVPLVILIGVAACQTTETQTCATNVVQVACAPFQPISYSRLDTEETRRQIVMHNAAYVAVCDK